MARPLRIELSGGLYHVTARGNRCEDIYFEAADRLAWLDLLSVVCRRFNWVCHAYCLMTNHYHLVVETPEGNLAQGMRHLNGVYSQYVNRAHRRVGHVFQGRYHAILVEKDSYLLELARYVVLNPVRARMTRDAADWPWSSYRAMTGQTSPPSWLETDWVLGQFGLDRQTAIRRYVDFVRAGAGLPSLWGQLRNQIYLGSERFVAHMQNTLESPATLTEVPRVQRRPVAKPLDHYSHEHADSAEAMAMAYLSGDYSMKAIAQHFNVHYATVSRAVRVFEAMRSNYAEEDMGRRAGDQC